VTDSDDIRLLPFGGEETGLEVPVPLADGTAEGPSTPDFKAWEQDFHGLLKLGYLTSSFEWCGHRIVIHTLRTDEELIISSMIKEWQDTIGGTKAYASAMVALCVDFVDGQPLPIPLGEERRSDNWARQRFAFVQRWYPFTIDAIYNEYLKLEDRVKKVITEMGKASSPVDGSSESAGSPASGDFSPDALSP
jgi:hypothetical protein